MDARSPTKAVLFDAAGTLFRVRGSVGEAYARVAARHGVIASSAEVERRFRSAFRNMPPLCFPGVAADALPDHERAWWRRVVTAAFAGLSFDDFEAFFRGLFEYFAQAGSWEVFPDVIPTLTELRARGRRLAIVSNFDGRLTSLCQGLGLAPFFDAIVMSSRAGCAKPDPRIFSIALECLGARAGETLHVGDSEALDVKGAGAAGLQAILIDRSASVEKAERHIRSLQELLARV